ncbi:MAG: DUF6055 domain-containing protein [Flavobacterium sp.]
MKHFLPRLQLLKHLLMLSVFFFSFLSCSSGGDTSSDQIDDNTNNGGATIGIKPPDNFPYVFAKKPSGKQVYVPVNNVDFTDLNSNSSVLSYERSASSDNIIVFWEKGFGQYPDKVSRENLRVDIKKLLDMGEQFFSYYKNTMKFVIGGQSKTDNYRMIVVLRFQETWLATGSGYDDTIGALWINPSTTTLTSVIAHEFGHSFQYQTHCDGSYGFRDQNYVGSFWEQCAQFMSWQQNNSSFISEIPMFLQNAHKNFSHEDMRYQSMYLMEYWKEKHGVDFLGRIWRGAIKPEGPLEAYMRITGISQEKFNDEYFEYASKNITWDYPLGSFNRNFIATLSSSEKLKYRHKTKLNAIADNYYQIDLSQVPEDYGYNAIKMVIVPEVGKVVSADLLGLSAATEAGWRWGFVAVKTNGTAIYGAMKSGSSGSVSFTIVSDVVELWLVVSGAPKVHKNHVWDDDNSNDIYLPYKVKFTNVAPE